MCVDASVSESVWKVFGRLSVLAGDMKRKHKEKGGFFHLILMTHTAGDSRKHRLSKRLEGLKRDEMKTSCKSCQISVVSAPCGRV